MNGFQVLLLLGGLNLVVLPGYAEDTDAIGKQIDRAARELSYFNFDRAHAMFTRVIAQIDKAGSELWQRAAYGLAVSAQCRTPADPAMVGQARALYAEIIDRAPDSAFAPRSMLNLGRIEEVRDYGGDVIDVQAARAWYRRVYETWPDETIADEAALRYADTYVQNFKHETSVREGVAFLERWIESRPNSAYAAMIWEYLGQVYYEVLQDPRQAVRAYLKADECGLVERTALSNIYRIIAQLSETELEDPVTAVRYYRKIIIETPRSGKALESRLALERLQRQHPHLEIDIPKLDTIYRMSEGAVGDEQKGAEEAR